MWNQVNCTQNYYANLGTSTPYNQWSYAMVSCPHQKGARGGGEVEAMLVVRLD
jgi:hypothetical protein